MINITDTETNGPLWFGDFRVKSPQHYVTCSYTDCAYNCRGGMCQAEVVSLTQEIVQIDGEIVTNEKCESFLSKQTLKDARQTIKEYEDNLSKNSIGD